MSSLWDGSETNCRNTEAISNQCGEVIGKKIKVMAGTPAGEKLTFVQAQTVGDQSKAMEKQIKEWSAGGLKPNQIAIVSARSMEASCCANIDKIGAVPVTDRLDVWREGTAVLKATLGKFKGLEADAIVLVDVPEIDANFRKEHLYVACSRAKFLLTVLTK